jgi:hypothetical protein
VYGLLLEVGKDVVNPSTRLASVSSEVHIARPTLSPAARRKPARGALVLEAAQSELLKVVLTLPDPRCFPRRLHRRQQQRGQDADDRDDDQKLDEGKTV